MSLSRLHPLSFGEILDGVFSLYRRHFAPLLATSALMAAPGVVVWTVLALLATGDPQSDAVLKMAGSLLYVPFGVVAGLVGWGALVQQAAAGVLGGEVSVRHGMKASWRRFWTLAAIMVIGVFAVVFGLLLFVVPGVLVAAATFAVFHAAVLEGASVPVAFERSYALARGALGRVLGVMTVFSIIGYLPVIALAGGVILFGMANPSAAGLWGSLSAEAVANVAGSVLGVFTAPLLPLALTLLYFDRRVRVEALDLAAPQPAAHPVHA